MISIITGPTGSGKSALAEELADKAKLEIVNADAFQMYREIPIVSNQPRIQRVRYHFLATRSIKDPTSAGDFSRFAQPAFKFPAIWVGTGLYLGAALYGLDTDRRKGTPFTGTPLHPYKMIVIEKNRDELYELLNLRVDKMIGDGAIEEVELIYKMLEASELKTNNPLLKTIGVRQMLMFLSGEVSRERAIELWKRDTRRLAKRQWTWLRGFCAPSKNIKWINSSQENDPLTFATHFFEL